MRGVWCGGSTGGMWYANLALVYFKTNTGTPSYFLTLHIIYVPHLLSIGHIMFARYSHITMLEFAILLTIEVTINRKNSEFTTPHTTALVPVFNVSGRPSSARRRERNTRRIQGSEWQERQWMNGNGRI